MRTVTVLAALIALASPAFAERRIVLMSDGNGWDDAMQIQLAGRGVVVAHLPSPAGALRLDRAADVQHTALANQADAGIWIERDGGTLEVCVVSSDGRTTRYAPLPDGSPRVFASIATSLLDEILAPEPAIDVHVDVNVNTPPPVVAAPGAIAPPTAVAVAAAERPRWNHAIVEIGPSVSPATYGVEAELAFGIAPALRFGVLASVHYLYDGINDMMAGDHFSAAGGELRYVGAGMHHFDVGAVLGIGTGAPPGNFTGDTGGIAGARLNYVWEGRGTGVELSFAPTLLLGFRGNSSAIPGFFASLRWMLPL
jgi:hypothetical protein